MPRTLKHPVDQNTDVLNGFEFNSIFTDLDHIDFVHLGYCVIFTCGESSRSISDAFMYHKFLI